MFLKDTVTGIARLAIVGTGRMAKIHFNNTLNNVSTECRYIISNSLNRATKFINMNNNNSLIKYDNSLTLPSDCLETTLKNNGDDFDAVVITSASNEHYEQIKQCLQYNKPVFVEKPVANTIQEIDEIYELCQQKNLPPVFVGMQRRFDPNIQYMYKEIYNNKSLLLQSDITPNHIIYGLSPTLGGIEKIISISRDPTYPGIDYLQSNYGINCFNDSIIHDIDTICFLTKQYPNKVYSATHAHYKPIEQLNDYDRVFITLEFPSGLLGMIDWCRHSGYSYDQRLNILGYNGMLELQNEKSNLIIKHNNNGSKSGVSVDYFLERYKEAYRNELDEFVQVLKSTKKVITTHESIRNVNIIISAAQKSADSGLPIEINYDRMDILEPKQQGFML